jgi:hypothetical protein
MAKMAVIMPTADRLGAAVLAARVRAMIANHGPANDNKYFNSVGPAGARGEAVNLVAAAPLRQHAGSLHARPSVSGSAQWRGILFLARPRQLHSLFRGTPGNRRRKLDRPGDPHELSAHRSCTTRTGPNQLSNKRNLVYMDIHRMRVSAGATSCFSRLRIPDNVSRARHS